MQKGDKSATRRAARLAIDFAGQLELGDRYRDLHQVAHEFLNLLEGSSSQFPEEVARMAIKDGLALRMLGRYQEAVVRLNQALGVENPKFSNYDYGFAYMELAHSYRALQDIPSAVEAAQLTLQFAMKDSGVYIQATELIAKEQEDEDTFRATMRILLQKARSKGINITTNNLAISLAGRIRDTKEALSLYDSVLNSKNDNYNKIRAGIAKAELLNGLDRIDELHGKDKRLLGAAYTHTHAQRLGRLFDQAHSIIWKLFASQPNSLPALIALYRHSSFLWRVRGESERELPYLTYLAGSDLANLAVTNSKIKVDLDYLRKRQAALQALPLGDSSSTQNTGSDSQDQKLLS